VAGWTPDSQQILFSFSISFSAAQQADGLSWRMMPLDSNTANNGGSSVTTAYDVLDYTDFTDISPDGTHLALVNGGRRDSTENKRLAVLDTTSGYAGKEVTGPDVAVSSPDWSPDGKTIAYVQQPASPDYIVSPRLRRIWLVDADGSNPRRLTKNIFPEERPQWSPDGRHIVYVRPGPGPEPPSPEFSGGLASIWLYELSTASERVLVDKIEFNAGGIDTNINYFGHLDWDSIFDWHR